MKNLFSLVASIALGATLIGVSSSASAQVLRNTPNKPDLDFSECPRKSAGSFQLDFTGPFPQADGSYKEETYYVSESVFVLMNESEFGFAKDYSDVSGYTHPDRFALNICASDALATIMTKRKGAANLAFAEQALDAQSQALEAKQKELEEANARLADLEAGKQPNKPAALSTPRPLVPPPSSSSQTLLQALLEQGGVAPARGAGGSEAAPQRSSTSAPPVVATSLPSTIDEDLASELDTIIARDSRSWVFNRYNRGSVHDVRVLGANAGNADVQGRYRYNGSSVGWIKVRFTDNKVNCVIYHDFPGKCRPVGQNPAGMIALSLFAGAAMSSAPGGSSSSASSGERTCRWVTKSYPRADGGPDRMVNEEVCD